MRNPSAIAAAVVALVLAVFVVLLATSDTQQSTTFNDRIIGEIAPPIEGPTLGGGDYNLMDRRGNWVVVNFFASWCIPCRIEHPELLKFNERHRNDPIEVVAVMFGDSEENATEFFNELGGDWPALVENTGSIAINYGVTAVPETLLVSPSGRVVHKWIGASGVTADAMDSVIAQLEGDG